MASENSSKPDCLRFAAVILFLGVGLGAFGAHGLPETANKEVWKTGVTYQLIHGLALFAFALAGWAGKRPAVSWCWVIGVILFSGSLYLLAFPGTPRWIGPITPLGGLSFMVGWLLLILKPRP